MRQKKNNSRPGIYMLRSKNDPEIFYIGATSNLYRSKYKHRQINRFNNYYHIQNHILKYGIDDLEFTIIEYCRIDELFQKEQFYISEFKPTLNINKIATNTQDKKSGDAFRVFYEDLKKEHINNKISPREEYLFNKLNDIIPEILIPLNI